MTNKRENRYISPYPVLILESMAVGQNEHPLKFDLFSVFYFSSIFFFSAILFYLLCPSERHSNIFTLAIENGAEVNIVAKDGTTALLRACEEAIDNESICLNLLKHGADPNLRNEVRSPQKSPKIRFSLSFCNFYGDSL